MTTRPRSDIGSLIVSLLFVAIGALTLRDTAGYMDFDSKIFPRAAGIALVITAGLAALLSLLRPTAVEGVRGFHWWRPLLLLAAMLGGLLLFLAQAGTQPGFSPAEGADVMGFAGLMHGIA